MNKHTLTTLCAMTILALSAAAQGTYQLPNGGFELWDGGNTSEPTHWNTFSSSDGTYSSLASSDHHYRRAGHRPGGTGSYYLTIYTKSILGIKANGNMTTGRIHAGSMSASSSDNYNYTQRGNSDHCLPFSATPDSMSVWLSFYAESGSSEAQVSAIIHDDSDFKSPNDEGSASRYKGKAAIRTTRTTSSASAMQWTKITVPFTYDGTAEAAYLLVNITTNKEPGGGAKNDSLSVDDIEFIYSAWLSDITFRGVAIDGFSKGTLCYTISVDDIGSLAVGDIQPVTEVGDATVQTSLAVVDDTTAEFLITVTAEDQTTVREYTVRACSRTSSGDVGIAAQQNSARPRFFPNPTASTLTVDNAATVAIVDNTGRTVLNATLPQHATVDISHLPKGLYTIILDNYKDKLIIQ